MTQPTPISRYALAVPSTLVSSRPPLISNQTYNVLKSVVTLVLPALGALYFSLSQIWGLPGAENIVGSIAAINVFLGVILGLTSRSYRMSDDRFIGDIEIQTRVDGTKSYSLNTNGDPSEIDKHKEVTFKVRKY